MAFIYCSNSRQGVLLTRKSRSSGVRSAVDLIECAWRSMWSSKYDARWWRVWGLQHFKLGIGVGLTTVQELSSDFFAGVYKKNEVLDGGEGKAETAPCFAPILLYPSGPRCRPKGNPGC